MDHCQPQQHGAHIPLHREEYHHGAPHHTMAGIKPHVAHIPLHRGEYHHGAPHHTMAELNDHVTYKDYGHCILACTEEHPWMMGLAQTDFCAQQCFEYRIKENENYWRTHKQEDEKIKAYGKCLDACFAENPDKPAGVLLEFCDKKCAGGQHTAPHLTRSAAPGAGHLAGTPEESLGQKIPGWMIKHFIELVKKLQRTAIGRWILEHVLGPITDVIGAIIIFAVFIKAVIKGESIVPNIG